MKKLISVLCLLLLCLGSAFAFVGCGDLSSNEDELTNNQFIQYFTDECPIGLYETSTGVGSSHLELNFRNFSDEKIIAYEAMYILYNVYGEALIYTWNTTKYNRISETPTNFTKEAGNFKSYSINSQVYYAEVYVYYVLFEDSTSWGYRLETGSDIVDLGTKFTIERY